MSQKFEALKDEMETRDVSNVVHSIIYSRSDDLDSYLQNNKLGPELVDYLNLNSSDDYLLDSSCIYRKCSSSEREKYEGMITNIHTKLDNGASLSLDDILEQSIQLNSFIHYTDSKGDSHLESVFIYLFKKLSEEKYVLDDGSGKFRLK